MKILSDRPNKQTSLIDLLDTEIDHNIDILVNMLFVEVSLGHNHQSNYLQDILAHSELL